MEGKIFLYSNGTPPPRIAISTAFTFDLQRFAEVTITQDTEDNSKYVVNNNTEPKYASLDAAIQAANVKFSVTTKSGQTETTKYYDAENDFKNDNLSGATEIKILGNITLENDVEVNLGVDKSNVIKIAGNDVTLNLGTSTLTIKREENGKTVSGVNYDTPASAIVVQNGATFNVKGDTTGTINYDWDPDSNSTYSTKCEQARTSAAVQVGERVGTYTISTVPANTDKATFNMQGGKITSNSTAISMSDNGVVNVSDGTVESNKGCGIYYGNSSPGGGKITVSGGTIRANESSQLAAIQVSGNVGVTTKHGDSAKAAEVEITGGTIEFKCQYVTDSSADGYNNYFEDTGKPKGNPAAIYAAGNTKLTMSGGTINTTATGVELRAGSLDFTGGTINSSATEYKIKKTSTSGGSGNQTFGAAITVVQHTTKENIEVNVSGNAQATGAVAFSVENTAARKDPSTLTVDITGGTFTSNDTTASAIALSNGDSRVKVDVKDAKFVGSLVTKSDSTSTGTGTSTEQAQIHVSGTITVVNPETKEEKIYDDKSLTFTEPGKTTGFVVEPDTWVQARAKEVKNTFYFVQRTAETGGESSVAVARAFLLPVVTESEAATTTSTSDLNFSLLSGLALNNYDNILALDLTDDTFGGLSSTFINLSVNDEAISPHKVNITGNDYLKAITGGDGDDTLTAGSAGVSLNGGKGNNLLQGGDGKDTFIHTAGTSAVEDDLATTDVNESVAAVPIHDTIDNYKIADDIVSLTNELPTDLANGISYNNTTSEFVVSLGGGAGDSLTFHSASEIKFIRPNNDTYYYRADRVIKNNNEATLGAAFSDKTFDLNKLSSDYVDYSKVAVIDASGVTVSGGLNIIANTVSSSATNFITSARTGGTVTGGNNGNTLISAATGEASLTFRGGEGNDSLVGGSSSKDLFIYTGGADSISGYASRTDVVRVNNTYRLAEATVAVGEATEDKADITLTFDNANSLIFEGIGADEKVRVQQGTNNNYYTYAQQYSAHNNSITLASGYTGTFNGADENYKNYETINAAAVTAENGISIVGNDNANYIFGPTAVNASIYGGANNDKINVSDRSSIASYLFEYTAGKDEIIGFDATKDTVDIAVENITAAKASSGKLALTVDKKNDVLTLRSEDEIEKVSLQSGGYLTKDGYVSGQGFSLFGSARGAIDLKDALYAGSSINSVVADSVKSQGVTLTGGAEGGTFIYATGNKKRDGFIYGGGAVSISGYEVGRDRIDLGTASLSSFSVGATPNGEVILKVGEGTISIAGAGGQEVLLRDTSKGNGYKKMVFAQTGVMENKAKNPTIVTVSGAAGGDGDGDVKSYTANDSIKKIYVTSVNNAISIQAGSRNNTQIDASAAGKAVSLSGGAKNDKLIGSSENDLFVYSAGKDVLQGYGEGDSISISSGLASSLGSAKITAGSKSIKFQFTNKNTLTIKSNSGDTLSNELTINETTQTYAKNAIESGGQATLTSAFSGTFNTASTKGIDGAVSTVNGAAVSRNLTYKGSTSAESLVGGMRKTTFKGGGGNDTLVGGSGKDIFFYAKGEQGTTKIADFDFGTNGRAGNDKLKIASGTISEITKAEDGKAIQFAMNTGKNTANVGWFQVTSGKDNPVIDATKVAIKANNTYYWFATGAGEDVNGNAVEIGQLITSDSRVSASDVSSYSVIDLNYSTNLAKAGVAVKVANAKPTT